MYRIIQWLLLLSLCTQLYGQKGKSIMIYTGDETFLVPLVFNYLHELEKDGVKYFPTVTNLNEVSANIKSEIVLREIIKHFSYQNYPLSDTIKVFQEKVAEQLQAHDFFLSIYINRINNVLEYQFYLYDSKSLIRDVTGAFPQNDIVKPISVTSFCVDINSPDYRDVLKVEIKKLFPECNLAPVAIITQGANRKQKYYLSPGDTLVLNGNFSYDHDIVGKQLQCLWTSETKIDKESEPSRSELMDRNGFCILMPGSAGVYKINLRVFDGIAYSLPDTVTVIVLKKPQIYVPYKQVRSWRQNFAWERKKYFTVTFDVLCSARSTIDSGQILYENERLKKDTISLFHEHYKQKPEIFVKKRKLRSLVEMLERNALDSNITFSRNNLGFGLNYKVPELEDVDEEYSIWAEEGELVSNKEKIAIKHLTYSDINIVLGYQSHAFDIGTKDSSFYSFGARSFIWGLSSHLTPLGSDESWLEGQLLLGVPFRQKADSAQVSMSLTASLMFNRQYGWAGFSFGVSGAILSFSLPHKELTTTYGKLIWDNNMIIMPTINIGFFMKPSYKLPLHIDAFVAGNFLRKKVNISGPSTMYAGYSYAQISARFNFFDLY